MIKQLTAVHSYVIRQKNDAKDTVLLSELENILLSPYFMSGRLEPSLSATELLLWLSVWRTGFELCDQFKTIPEWKLKHLFDVLVSLSTCIMPSGFTQWNLKIFISVKSVTYKIQWLDTPPFGHFKRIAHVTEAPSAGTPLCKQAEETQITIKNCRLASTLSSVEFNWIFYSLIR